MSFDGKTLVGEQLTRRGFLAAAAVAPLCLMNSSYASQTLESDIWNEPRWVWLRHYKTGEEIKTVYFADGEIIQDQYERVCWFLRDRTAGKGMFMSTVLLDVLYAQCAWMNYHGYKRPYMSTSGARFSETNAKTEGAALNSRHVTGEAHDGYIPGVSMQDQRDLAVWIAGGGVGYYPQRNFIHTDVGNARFWRGR